MSMCRVISYVVGRGGLLWPVCSLGKTLFAFALLHFVLPRPNLPVTPGVSWLPTFAFQSPMMKGTSFFGVSSTRSCMSSQNRSASSALTVAAQIWITLLLNGLPWKRTELILLFLRLHPSTAFRTLFNLTVLYSIRLHFHHQSHPQLGIVFALAPSLCSFWSYFSTLLQQHIGHLPTWGVLLSVFYFLPFHTVHGVLKARILK